MREICFTIQWKELPSEDIFIQDMINFSISNKVSFAGGIEEFCFCVDIGQPINNPNKLEKKCLEFLNYKYLNKILSLEKTNL